MNFTTSFRSKHNKTLQTCTALASAPPLLAPLLAYILGSLAALLIEKPNPVFLQLAPVALIFHVLWRKSPGRFSVLATAMVWGGVATWVALVPDPYHAKLIQEVEDRDVVLQGRVLQVEPQPQRWRMDLQLKSIRHNWHRADAENMRVRIHVASETPATTPQIYPGDHVVLRTSLRKPRPFGTPGEFNYARYLIQRDIVASGFVADAESIARMAPAHPPALSARIARWRQHTGADIAALLPQESSAYVLSLALGEKTRLSPKQREVLAFTGLSHLFSISGLHLGMIAAFIYVVLQSIYRRSTSLLLWQPMQKTVPLLCLPGVVVYLFMSGEALPTLRATAMLCVAALIALLDYRTRPGAILLLVGGLILIADPLALYSASFQLSFAGAGALLLVLPVWHRRLKPGWRRRGILLLLTSYTACLATAPFALWHFHTLAPAAMINNIFAVPLVSFIVLPITLGATALFSIAPDLSLPLLEWSGTMISIILESAQKIAVGPLSGRYIYPSLQAFSAVSLVCVALV
ncbi:MAG: ComEC/Rec2 family competence protein, partial [Thermodesulfobacteriota bacterium]